MTTSLLILCLMAFLAGFTDAIVGGGGLIQLPAMFVLMPQLSLLQTLGTNKMASFSGTLVAALRYMKRVKLSFKSLLPAMLSALAGAWGGALLVSLVRKEQFMPFILTMLVLVLIYTVLKKNFGMERPRSLSPARHLMLSLATGSLIGVYDGLIGPGTGSFLIFAYVLLFGYSFLEASAHAKLINCVTNISALSFFLFQDAIVWSIALPAALSNMLGNYLGAQMALRRGNAFVRVFFIVVTSALILKLGWDYVWGS